MSLCVDLGYEVVTDTLHVSVNPPALQEVRVTAPTGKKPVSGGFKCPWGSGGNFTANNLVGSYPDGNDWVFQFADIGYTLNGYDVDLYVVCVNV